MKRRNFIHALLGTAAIVPLLPLLGRDEIVPMPTKPLQYSTAFRGLKFHVGDSGVFQGLLRATITKVDLKNKTFTVDTIPAGFVSHKTTVIE